MITVQRESADRLSMQEWRFWADLTPGGKLKMKLSGYSTFTRPTTRHKYVRQDFYDIYDKRYGRLPFTEVPTPQDVSDEAVSNLFKTLDFKWEWK